MTSKERAKFRAKANALDPIFQIGKEGISENLTSQLSDALDARELIKIRVHLETAPETPRQLADKIGAQLQADVIQVIGGVIVLYRKSEKLERERKEKQKYAANAMKKHAAKNGKDKPKRENRNFRRGI